MLEICVQSGNWYKENDPEWSFRYIRECGFEGIDYNIDQFLSYNDLINYKLTKFFDQSVEELLVYYEPIKESAVHNNIKFFQMHAPFPLYAENRADMNDYLIMSVEKCCAICKFLGCPALVVHPFSHQDKVIEKKVNLQMYRRMIPGAKKYGIKLCLENLYICCNGHIIECACTDAGEACWYIDTLNKEAGEEVFGFCLDTGHANMLRRNIREFIRALDKRLTILHIHDNTGNVDLHMLPYTLTNAGGINWEEFVLGLRDIGYIRARFLLKPVEE